MRKTTILFLGILLCIQSSAQSVQQLLRQVQASQRKLQHVSYTIVRQDTLVTGHVRQMQGTVKISLLPTDTVLGFRFWARDDRANGEMMYDGNSLYTVNHQHKTYSVHSNPELIPHLLGAPGGQLVLTDLVKIDTSGATGFRLTEDATYYHLVMSLADLTKYDVIKRSRTYVIDKKSMLPVGMIAHQETLGKVQDLNFRIQQWKVNEAATTYDFAAKRYPDSYTKEESTPNKKLYNLKGKQVPGFKLEDFNGAEVSMEQYRGKLLLLDFWEVWCGPCVESMPKVQGWQDKYQSKGLQVIGITHEKDHLSSAKKLVEKNKVCFPMLLGNSQTKTAFSIMAVPVYVLVGKDGKVIMVSEGFTPLLEEEIQRNL